MLPLLSLLPTRGSSTGAGSPGCSATTKRGRCGTRWPPTATRTGVSGTPWNPIAGPPAASRWRSRWRCGSWTRPGRGTTPWSAAPATGWPRSPWWVPEDGHPASVIATGLIAGTLHARGVSHPWLGRATGLMWTKIDALARSGGSALSGGPGGEYEMLGMLSFLQHVPDRERAREVFGRVGPLILERKMVALDPEAPGEVHTPLDYAPDPDSLARELFDEATIKAHLEHLARAQRDDGGWMFNWLAWSPAAERDWRGFLTVDALRLLRANGRWTA